MMTLVAFVVIFGTIVFFHELGHFAVAKLSGIRVYEFALGFGPALGSITRGETKYSIRAFP
ncbi:MAG TPA: site-2 protease family protein, partial [Limnochordia bacterium]|nr:site-2 protease family protein [Limnochordia bacterium]